jgi:hypothetical protein
MPRQSLRLWVQICLCADSDNTQKFWCTDEQNVQDALVAHYSCRHLKPPIEQPFKTLSLGMAILKTHSNNTRKKIMTATSISLSVNINEDEALEALTILSPRKNSLS